MLRDALDTHHPALLSHNGLIQSIDVTVPGSEDTSMEIQKVTLQSVCVTQHPQSHLLTYFPPSADEMLGDVIGTGSPHSRTQYFSKTVT